MKWACAAAAAFMFAAAISAFPPGTQVGQPSLPISGGPHAHVFRDIAVPINQVTAVGNMSIRGSIVDIVRVKKLENGNQMPERIVTGARFVGFAPDHKSIILRIPENDIGAVNDSLKNGSIILTLHR